MTAARSLPQSPEAERTVLGGIMLDQRKFDHLSTILQPEDFYREAHQRLWRLMQSMVEAGSPVEMMAVVEEVAARGMGEAVGGLAYVSSLPDQVPSTENLAYYAHQVRRRAVRRGIIFHAREVEEKAFDLSVDDDEVVEKLQAAPHRDPVAQAADLLAVCQAEYDRVVEAAEQKTTLAAADGIRIGLAAVDRIITLRPGHQIVVAGRPAMGKTCLALQALLYEALNGNVAAIFSLEMLVNELARRYVQMRTPVNYVELDQRPPTAQEVRWIGQALESFSKLPLKVYDRGWITPGRISSQVRHLRHEYGERFRAWAVDHIGLVRGANPGESRENFISRCSRTFKAAAAATETASILVSQLNREVEKRSPPLPVMSDLRESGSLEQDANGIILVYRPSYYTWQVDPDAEFEPDQIIIAKQRSGGTGVARVVFKPQDTRFESLRYEDETLMDYRWRYDDAYVPSASAAATVPPPPDYPDDPGYEPDFPY